MDCWALPEDRPVSCPYAHMLQSEPVGLLSLETLQKLDAVPTNLSRAPLLMITLWRGESPACARQGSMLPAAEACPLQVGQAHSGA